MFGYATNETEELLPLTVVLSHRLNTALAQARRDGSLPWLRPDTKTQVTVEYKNEGGAVIPLRVDTIVVSTQHADEITTEDLRSEIKEKIIKKVIPEGMLDDKTIYHIQPSGRFVIGGPQGDAGLTGRKVSFVLPLCVYQVLLTYTRLSLIHMEAGELTAVAP